MALHEPERPALRALASANFSVGIMSYGLVGALPVLAQAWQRTPGDTALLLAAFSMAYALGAPLLQMTLGHLERRRLLLAGVVVMALGTLAAAMASSFSALLLCRVATGLAAGAVAPVAQAIGVEITPPARRGRALAVVFAGVTLSSVIAAPLMAFASHAWGWRAVFFALAALTLASGAWMAATVHDRRCGTRMQPSQLLRLLLRPATATGLAVMVLQTAAFFATYTLALPLATARFGSSAAQAAFALLVFGVAGVAGNLLAQRLSLKHSAVVLLRAVMAVMLPLFGVLALLGAWPGSNGLRQGLALCLLVAWALMQDLFYPSQLRRVVELEPDARGMIIALNSASIFIGISLGAAVGGRVADQLGLGLLAPLSALLTLCAAGMLAVSAWLRTRAP